jgi:hypothetical protein
MVVVIILTPQNKPRQQLKYTNWNKQKSGAWEGSYRPVKSSRGRGPGLPCVCVCVWMCLCLCLSRASSIAGINPWALFGRWLSCHLLSPGTDGANTSFLACLLPSQPLRQALQAETKEGKIRVRRRHPPPPSLHSFLANFIHHCTLEDGWKVFTPPLIINCGRIRVELETFYLLICNG